MVFLKFKKASSWCYIFALSWGDDPIWLAHIFANGFKPTTRFLSSFSKHADGTSSDGRNIFRWSCFHCHALVFKGGIVTWIVQRPLHYPFFLGGASNLMQVLLVTLRDFPCNSTFFGLIPWNIIGQISLRPFTTGWEVTKNCGGFSKGIQPQNDKTHIFVSQISVIKFSCGLNRYIHPTSIV